MLKSFCIGHMPALFSPPIPFTLLSSSILGLPNELTIADNRFGTNLDGGSLAEYSQIFGLVELLKAGDIQADRLHLFQYRKFISPKYLLEAPSDVWISYVQPNVAEILFPSEQQIMELPVELIVGSSFVLSESIAKNYAQAHEIEDFVQFVVACYGSGVLDYQDTQQITSMKEIIFSPALCIIDTKKLIQICDQLFTAWIEYSKYFHTQRTGYQRRISGYLLERLHSYLIFKGLIQGTIQTCKIWKRYLVVNEMNTS